MLLGARRTTREAGWGWKKPFSFLSNSKVVRSFFIVLEFDAEVEYQLKINYKLLRCVSKIY